MELATLATTLAAANDEVLVGRVAAGDASAFAELYDRHRAAAFGTALRVLKSRSLAEDAVQEAFLGVWRSAASYRHERASVRSWILVHVHRRAVDGVRRNQRWHAHHPAAAEAASPSVSESVELADERRAVQAALACLPDSSRTLLELAYYGGLTQSQVAQVLGMPLGTVKSRTHAALARMRDLLAEGPVEPIARAPLVG